MGQSTREAEKHELAERPQRYDETLFAIEGEDIANIVFDRYRVGFSMQMESRELERTMDSALLTYGEIEARVRERMEHRRAHEPDRSRTEEGDTPQK